MKDQISEILADARGCAAVCIAVNNLAAAAAFTGIADKLEALGGWQDISTAPKDGLPVLLKFKNELPKHGSGFAGVTFVGRNSGDYMHWSFAAPVGMGGFTDEWLEGWQPLPAPPKESCDATSP